MVNYSNLSVKEIIENLYKKGYHEVSLVLKLKERGEHP